MIYFIDEKIKAQSGLVACPNSCSEDGAGSPGNSAAACSLDVTHARGDRAG